MYGELIPIGGGDSIPLLKDRLQIGRRPSCDIRLDFANVSAMHCEMCREDGFWEVHDLGSTNGIKVNGERVSRKRMYPGDELEVAKHKFRIEYMPSWFGEIPEEDIEAAAEAGADQSLLEKAGLTRDSRGGGGKGGEEPSAGEEELATFRFLKRHLDRQSEDERLLEAQEPEDAVGGGTAGVAPAAEAAAASAANPADDFADDEFEKLIEREVERPKRAKKSGGKRKKAK